MSGLQLTSFKIVDGVLYPSSDKNNKTNAIWTIPEPESFFFTPKTIIESPPTFYFGYPFQATPNISLRSQVDAMCLEKFDF